MRREACAPRANWRERCEQAGFGYHSVGGTYWDESACWVFSEAEVDRLEAVSAELHEMCLTACDEVIAGGRLAQFAIPEAFHAMVEQSWRERAPSLYGRFDLAWDGTGEPRMLEYNADTPTALLEASVVQWHWLEDLRGRGAGVRRRDGGPGQDADQFNSLHEKLIARWETVSSAMQPPLAGGTVHFTCLAGHEEDFGNCEYLRDTAVQAGLDTAFVPLESIGWDGAAGQFVDADGQPVAALFKLYPWEWLVADAFGANLLRAAPAMLEPPWKMLLSNKAILAVLWELFPGHPNLLAASLDASAMSGDYVRKPLLSREGANVSVRAASGALSTPGSYGAEGWVYQALTPLARAGGGDGGQVRDNYMVIGSWIIGDEPAGIGLREDDSPVTRDTSRFVPHYFE
jgi:glutathionylspermidine synthase